MRAQAKPVREYRVPGQISQGRMLPGLPDRLIVEWLVSTLAANFISAQEACSFHRHGRSDQCTIPRGLFRLHRRGARRGCPCSGGSPVHLRCGAVPKALWPASAQVYLSKASSKAPTPSGHWVLCALPGELTAAS